MKFVGEISHNWPSMIYLEQIYTELKNNVSDIKNN